ncbi:hypothetical protein J6590_072449 [Homalodisca vitripennis]|nr:hypothetical protein J6590_072449 [Homalodisca vitripennis]
MESVTAGFSYHGTDLHAESAEESSVMPDISPQVKAVGYSSSVFTVEKDMVAQWWKVYAARWCVNRLQCVLSSSRSLLLTERFMLVDVVSANCTSLYTPSMESVTAGFSYHGTDLHAESAEESSVMPDIRSTLAMTLLL